MAADCPDWLNHFGAQVAAGDVAAALAVLRPLATAHAGTPPLAVKQSAARECRRLLPDVGERWPLIEALLSPGDTTAAELALLLLPVCYPASPRTVLEAVHRLADHPHWEVREYAGEALGALLTHHWSDLYAACTLWREEPSENLRRAVVIAAKVASRTRNLAWASPLLDLIAPLLRDRRPYVRKNLGPFALGSGLLSAYPVPTWARLRAWAADPDEVVRWNVAMALSTTVAARQLAPALKVLAVLGHDRSPLVRRAMTVARRRLAHSNPGS